MGSNLEFDGQSNTPRKMFHSFTNFVVYYFLIDEWKSSRFVYGEDLWKHFG